MKVPLIPVVEVKAKLTELLTVDLKSDARVVKSEAETASAVVNETVAILAVLANSLFPKSVTKDCALARLPVTDVVFVRLTASAVLLFRVFN